MAKFQLNTNLRNMKNKSRCYNIGDYALLILGLLIAMLPIINIYQVSNNGRFNLIEWDTYYTQDVQTYTTGYNHYIAGSNDTQYIRSVARAGSTSLNIVGESYEDYDVGGYRRVTCLMNGTSDLTFNYEYDVRNAKIYDVMFTSIFPIKPIYSTENYHAHTNDTIIEGANGYIPNNWDNVWSNINVYMYIIDDNNNGMAYCFGRDYSVTKSDFRTKTLTVHSGIVNLKVYDVDISSDYDGTNMIFNVKPYDISEELFLTEDVIDIYGMIGQVFTYQGIASNLEINHPIQQMEQLYGFYNPSKLPLTQQISKIGYYIEVNKDFNILNYTGTLDMSKFFVTPDDITVNFVNGFMFEESNLYVGKIVSVKKTLENIIVFDGIVIITGIGVVIMLFLLPTDELKSYRNNYKDKCFIKKNVSD